MQQRKKISYYILIFFLLVLISCSIILVSGRVCYTRPDGVTVCNDRDGECYIYGSNDACWPKNCPVDPDCEDTSSTEGSEGGYEEGYDETDGIPWIVIIGAIGVIGVAAVAGAKVLGKKSPTPQKPSTPSEKEKEKKKPVQYILQFLPESLAKTAVKGVVHLQAGPGGSASFTVLVKKRLQDGTITSAPEAQISIVPKPGTEGISVAPSRGSGQVSCTVSVDKNVTAETGELVVSVTGAGGGFSTNVIVDIDQNYRVEFE